MAKLLSFVMQHSLILMKKKNAYGMAMHFDGSLVLVGAVRGERCFSLRKQKHM